MVLRCNFIITTLAFCVQFDSVYQNWIDLLRGQYKKRMSVFRTSSKNATGFHSSSQSTENPRGLTMSFTRPAGQTARVSVPKSSKSEDSAKDSSIPIGKSVENILVTESNNTDIPVNMVDSV
jgi:hypothetical protein